MTKLKQVKALVERLPEEIHTLPGKDCMCEAHSEQECGCCADWTSYAEWNNCRKETLDTTLPQADECVELDLEKLDKAIQIYVIGQPVIGQAGKLHLNNHDVRRELVKLLANTKGLIKWKTKGE